MKILIVSFFGLEETTPRAFRAKSLFNSLKILGHDVEFVSARKINKTPQDIKAPPLRPRIPRAIRSALGNFLSRTIPDGKVFFEAIKLLPKIKSQSVELTITIGLPFTVHLVTWVALKLNRLKTSRIIADYGDPFSTNPISKKPFYSKSLERLVLKSFDKITIPVESAAAAYIDTLVPPSKIEVIPQGFNISESFSGNYQGNPIPTFAYAGIFYNKIRDPSTFLELLSKVEYEFTFHIYTELSNTQTINLLEPYVSKLGSRMVLHDKIPRSECLEVLSKMDFLINFSNATSIQSPSKIVDYVLSGRPFLTINQENPDLKSFIEFLHKDYSAFEKPDISKFDEINVAKKFSQLGCI